MPIINVTGWKPGFKTVSFIKLLREQGKESCGLAEAKSLVDGLLQGKPFSVSFASEQEAASFIQQANGLGAIAKAQGSTDDKPVIS
jgi:hypothetical protein